MKTPNDSIIENFMFDYILRRQNTQDALLTLIDTVHALRISSDAKDELLSTLVGHKVLEETSQIENLIQDFRAGNTIPKIYQVILSFIEESINIDDTNSLKYLEQETRLELEHYINEVSGEIIEDFSEFVKKTLLAKCSFLERFGNDFLDENEKNEAISEISNYTYTLCDHGNAKLQDLHEMIEKNIRVQKEINDL